MKTVSNDHTSVTLTSPFLLFAQYYMPQVQKVSTGAYHILTEPVLSPLIFLELSSSCSVCHPNFVYDTYLLYSIMVLVVLP